MKVKQKIIAIAMAMLMAGGAATTGVALTTTASAAESTPESAEILPLGEWETSSIKDWNTGDYYKIYLPKDGCLSLCFTKRWC